MNRYGALETVLLALTALILIKMQRFEARPLPTLSPGPVASSPAVREVRKADADPQIPFQNMESGFKVFPKKNRVGLRPIGSVVSQRPTRSHRRRPTAGRRIFFKQDPRSGDDSSSGGSGDDSSSGGSGEGGSGEGGSGEGGSGGSGSDGGSGEGGSGGGGSGGGGSGGGGSDGGDGKELTIKYGDDQGVWKENSFQGGGKAEKIDNNPVKKYTPSMNLTTVCANKSTIYNEFKIEKWLMRGLNSKKKKDRVFLLDLRRELFDKGESESCHNSNYSDWQKYQECALRRNQRMEYFIPKYPRQQVVLE